jgi:hypothetical protein
MVPAAELLQQPAVWVFGEPLQAALQPGVIVGQPFIDGLEDSAVDEQAPHVSRDSVARVGIEGFVGQRDSSGRKVG